MRIDEDVIISAYQLYNVITLTLFGRGGQGIKSAAHIVSTTAFLDGNHVQDQPLYGAERRGAPISAFIRISREPILARGYIPQPFYLVVADDSLLEYETSNPLHDITEETVILVNSTMSAEKIQARHRIKNKIITADLTQLATEILGRPMVSVAVAGAANKLIGLDIENLKQAIALELKEIGIRDEDIVRNIHLATSAYDAVPHVESKLTEEVEERRYEIVELKYHDPRASTCTVTASGNSSLRRTGDWSVFKPLIDYEKCTKCMICYVYCPDSAISLDKNSFPVVDFNACKGCDICSTECPTQAITLVKRAKE